MASSGNMLKLETHLSKHFYFVDVARGLAALVVLIGHYQHFFYAKGRYSKVDFTLQPFYSDLYFFYHNGAMAVKLFWVISGFVFAAAYLSSEIPTARSFVIKRFARLYPLHLLTLVLVAVLQLISLYTTKHYQIYQYNDWYHFGLNVGLVSSWGFQKGYSFNAPIWSVSVEVFIYILFYISLRFLKKAPILFTAVIVLAFNFFIEKGSFLFPFKFCGVFFFLGIGVYILLNLFRKQKYLMLICSGLTVVTVSLIRNYNPNFVHESDYLMVLLPSVVLFLSSMDLMDENKIGAKLKFIGDLSFSVYLCHVPIEISIMLIMENFGVDKSMYSSPIFFIGYIIMVIGISYCSYRFFEIPMRNYFREKRPSQVMLA